MRRILLYLIITVGAASLPLALAAAAAAFDAEPVRYSIITLAEPGGRVLFYFELKNAGTSTWAPGSVSLSNVKTPMGAAPQHGLNRSVLPNETAYWDFEVSAPGLPGVHESVWQLTRSGGTIGPRMTCYVVSVPKEAQALRARIQTLIDEFNREHGHEVDQVIRLIRDLIAREGKGIIERLIESRCGLLSGLLTVFALLMAAKRG